MCEYDHNVKLGYFGYNEVCMEGTKNKWSLEESFHLIYKGKEENQE